MPGEKIRGLTVVIGSMATHACRVCSGALEILEGELRNCADDIVRMETFLFGQRTKVALSKSRAKDSRKAVLTGVEAEEKPWLALGSKPTPEAADAVADKEMAWMVKDAAQLDELYKKRQTVQAERDEARKAYLCCIHRYI